MGYLRRIADFTFWCRLPTLLLGVGCRLYFLVSAAPTNYSNNFLSSYFLSGQKIDIK
jgi:hypothetical protein